MDKSKVKESIKFFLTALLVLAAIYLAKLFHLLEEPLFSKVYYGNMNQTFYSISASLFWALFFVLIVIFTKKVLKYKIFTIAKKELSLPKTLIIYLLTVLPIIIISATLNFKLKIVYDLGEKVTGMQLKSNIVMYVENAFKVLLAVVFIALVQKGYDNLIEDSKNKYLKYIPLGGLALMLTFGIIELIIAYNRFSIAYLFFNLLFGIIYLISERNANLTFWVSLIIYIL